MSLPDQTANFKFWLPALGTREYHKYMNQNMQAIDALVERYLAVNDYVGVWQNATAYTAGQRALDPDTAQIYECLVNHTSSVIPQTFEEERDAFTDRWELFSIEFAFRGAWANNTSYNINDFVVSGQKYAVCTQAHTSNNGGTFATDESQYWVILIDLTSALASASASAVSAAASAVIAASSAAAVQLPDPAIADTLLVRNAGNTIYEAKSFSQVIDLLNLVIGSDVQAWDANLDTMAALASVARLSDVAGLAVTNGGFIEANGSAFALRVPMVVGSFTPVLRFGATNASSSNAIGLYVTFATALGSFGLVHIAVNLTNKNGGSGQTRINAIPIAPLTTSAACSLAPNDGWDFDMGVSAQIGTSGEINFYKGPTTAGGSLAGYQDTDVGATASSMTVTTAFRIS